MPRAQAHKYTLLTPTSAAADDRDGKTTGVRKQTRSIYIRHPIFPEPLQAPSRSANVTEQRHWDPKRAKTQEKKKKKQARPTAIHPTRTHTTHRKQQSKQSITARRASLACTQPAGRPELLERQPAQQSRREHKGGCLALPAQRTT